MIFNLLLKKKGMCPKNSHRNARQRKLWKDKLVEIITSDSVCCRCGKKASLKNPLMPHHLNVDAYNLENYHLYETLSSLLPYVIICKKCHFADHKGMKICSICNDKYCYKRYPSCFSCSGKSDYDLDLHGSIEFSY